MAGGIFDDRPFSINIKCVVVTLLIAFSYWFLLGKSRSWKKSLIIFSIFTLAFLLYDYMYSCSPMLIYANIAKAMIFSLVITSIAYIVPYRSIFVLLLLLYLPYLLNTWYDWFFDCTDRLQPTIFPFGRYVYLPFKPEDYKERWNLLPESRKLDIARYDKFFLLILVGILLIYFIAKLISLPFSKK